MSASPEHSNTPRMRSGRRSKGKPSGRRSRRHKGASSQKSGNKARKLQISLAPSLPATVPKRWVKFIVGLFLLIPAGILTQTFFLAFARSTLEDNFWVTEQFWFFSLGLLLWLIMFFGLPRPMWIYVFGHEITHAIWVLLLGGRVHRVEVKRDGGYILATKTNTWIALAPYFFPLYSLIAILLYGLIGLFVDVTPYSAFLYGVLGITWGFHLTFTCWMIFKGQPDLQYGGTFFSLVIIYLLNLLCLCLMLVLAAPCVSASSFLQELYTNTMEWTVTFTLTVNNLLR